MERNEDSIRGTGSRAPAKKWKLGDSWKQNKGLLPTNEIHDHMVSFYFLNFMLSINFTQSFSRTLNDKNVKPMQCRYLLFISAQGTYSVIL